MKELTDEEAVDLALTFDDLQSKVIRLCSAEKAKGYRKIAEMLGERYVDVQKAGRRLQALRLAYISVVKNSLDHYAGSALFLNKNGEKVKKVVELRDRLEEKND